MAPQAPPRAVRWQLWRRWQVAVGSFVLALLAGVALGEWMGWPFLAAPLQNFLAEKLGRRVQIASNDFTIRFVGGVRLNAPQFEVAAPAWCQSPHMISATDVLLEMRYVDLWRAYTGQRLRIHKLQASSLDGYLERRADGAASWQFGATPSGVASHFSARCKSRLVCCATTMCCWAQTLSPNCRWQTAFRRARGLLLTSTQTGCRPQRRAVTATSL